MQVAKWGNSLAVRLPTKLVEQLGLKPGDNVELMAGEGQLSVYKRIARDEALRRLFEACDRNPMVPDDYVFDRDEAHER
jgi:antitoxin MazE